MDCGKHGHSISCNGLDAWGVSGSGKSCRTGRVVVDTVLVWCY